MSVFYPGIHCSSPTITNCIVDENTAFEGGGICCFDQCAPTITNCTLSDNTARYGDGICCNESSPVVSNTIIRHNASDALYLYDDASNPIVTCSDIQGGWEGEGNIDADPRFVGDGDYHLSAGSSLHRCRFRRCSRSAGDGSGRQSQDQRELCGHGGI